MKFSSFVDKKTNKARRELGIIKDILEGGGLHVKEFLKGSDPHLYVSSTKKSLDFGGVRVYKIGSSIAYRIQNESDTQPYGMSYPLDVEKMFEDLLGEMNEEKAADEIKKAVVEELQHFFDKSLEAQDEIGSQPFDPHSKIVAGGKGGDLSNMM